MQACDLTNKKCKPCEGGVPPLKPEETEKFLKDVPHWNLEGNKIHRQFTFSNFVEAMRFVNQVADVAESEGHHPDILIYSYKRVKITLYTHAVNGLTENDFIVAAKIDTIKK